VLNYWHWVLQCVLTQLSCVLYSMTASAGPDFTHVFAQASWVAGVPLPEKQPVTQSKTFLQAGDEMQATMAVQQFAVMHGSQTWSPQAASDGS
jgi:hypothetical protein